MDKSSVKKQRTIHNLPIGYTQGRLTVVSEAYSVRVSPKATKRCVDCTCSCGVTKQVKVSEIASGRAKSCGCLSREALDKGVSKYEAGFRSVLRVYEYSAKERNLEFNLSRENFENLVLSDCTYCGQEPSQFQTRFSEFKYNGIDRVDNSLGYVEGNCAPCCKLCNRMKDVMSVKEFKDHVKSILDFQRGNHSA